MKVHFGIHINPKYIEDINKDYGMQACQIFTHGPRSTYKTNINSTEVYKLSRKLKMHVWIHSTYLTNLWKDEEYAKKLVIDEIKELQTIKAKGLVIHLPKSLPSNLVPALHKLTKLKVGNIVLEMKACIPDDNTTYESPEKINRFIDNLKEHKISHRQVSICIDTAHIYSSGQKISTYKQATDYLSNLKYPKWVSLIHLNGSNSKNNKDVHAVPFGKKDFIWKKYTYQNSGFRAFIEFAIKYKCDIIFEIDVENNIKDSTKLFDLMKNL